MNTITIETVVDTSIEKVWEMWTSPDHITGWAFASNDWTCPRAENDIRKNGRFLMRMEAKDGSTGFDFTGTYTEVTLFSSISYTMDDGRTASIIFEKINDNETKVTETFEMEGENSEELQRGGWQSILDNFKKYTEAH
ncbi:MAG: SRPBCC domain-containing protein [Candidatus Pacebacteria bacterium]|nr:SRPBCC domain-containing protein [Candidatus Paceibacterota bacterium]